MVRYVSSWYCSWCCFKEEEEMIFTFAKERNNTVYEEHHANFGMEFETAELGEVVLHFEDFLRGCGFVFEGHLDFVEDEK
jgi:hypothetical protein